LHRLPPHRVQVVQQLYSEQFFAMWEAYGDTYRVHVRIMSLPVNDQLRDLRYVVQPCRSDMHPP
jgi:hypothetical protein